jgi:penicillin-binding protein 2
MKLGDAFCDSVIATSRKNQSYIHDDSNAWWLGAGRILIFSIGLFIAFFILMIRLVDLTLVRGYNYRVLAEANRTRELIRHAPRGILRDRSGQPIVDNVVKYRLLKPCLSGESITIGGCVASLSKSEGDQLLKNGLPLGTFLETDYERTYRNGESVAHVAGYTGEVSEKELANEYYALRGYRPGDKIGRMGAEAIYEDKLRGRDGKELVEVDAEGRLIRMLGRDNEIPGSDVTLSLDLELSEIVRRAFPVGMKGAVIVTKPSTGEVLSLYSSPSFDPNSFSLGMTGREYKRLISDKSMPLFNRVISGVYPPGSTYKLVVAVAGLEEGSLSPSMTIEDTGIINVGTFSFSNWYFTQYGKTEGLVNITKAITRSNDIYFYKAGEKIGIEKLAKWSKILGIGTRSKIELAGEESGLMPNPVWKNIQFSSPADIEARNNLWYDGDTYHVSIGQGYLLTTPLQVNLWTNAVATGKLCQPTIEKVTQDKSHPAVCRDLHLKSETVDNIYNGMVGACDAGGTGWPLFGFGIKKVTPSENNLLTSTDLPAEAKAKEGNRQATTFTRIPVACKTGTAEIGDTVTNKTHAWFTVTAPVPEKYIKNISQVDGQTGIITGDPEITVTVLVEEGGEGSNVAAPIAKVILEKWFSR